MLVHSDRDADVVVTQPDTVGAQFGRAGRGGTGIEHVSERNAGETHHADNRVRIGHRPTAADRELDVFPRDTRIGEGELNGVAGHLHGGLAVEATERVQTHTDDGNVVHTIVPDSRLANVTGSAVGERKGWP